MAERTAPWGTDSSSEKVYWAGTHRTLSPSETVRQVRPFLRVMGITRVADVTGLDDIGIPVVMVTRPNSRALSVSQGKGPDLAAAEASGIMEAVEGFHAERVTDGLRLATARELSPAEPVLDLEAVPRAAGSTGLERTTTLLWIEGHDLGGGGRRWVPYNLVHLDYTGASTLGGETGAVSSNGLASGNTIDEAVTHALCELIERDARLLWRLQPERRHETRLALESVSDPVCRSLVASYREAGVLVGAWDITSDIGVPSFLARIVDAPEARNDRMLPPASGSGCHPDPAVALARALTEAAQSRLSYIAGSRDDLYRSNYDQLLDPETREAFRAEIGDPPGEAGRRMDEVAGVQHAAVEADVDWLVECLGERGLEEVVVVDLTRPEFGIPVVRAVVPGLEGPAEKIPDYVPGPRAARYL